MISIWNKNLKAFKERFASLYDILLPHIDSVSRRLEACSSDEEYLASINELFPFWKIEISRNGSPSVKELIDGKFISLHSAYAPEKEAQRFCEEASSCTESIFLFESFGLGYQVTALAEKCTDRTYILCEPDPLRFLCAISLLDFENVFRLPEVILAIGSPVETIVNITEAKGGFSRTRIFSQSAQSIHAEAWYHELNLLAKRNKDKAEINTNTLERFSGLWLKNSARNLDLMGKLSGVNLYFNKTALPSVIFAAGPTLENVLPFLKQISSKAITICVDTALRALLRHGVEPDFIVITDPQYYAAKHLQGLSSPGSVLITESAAYPSVFRFPARKIILCSSLFPMGQYFESRTGIKGKLDSGGSVATTCWDFARNIGSKEIYFAGLDLGYPQKKTHIRGSTFEEASHTISRRTLPAENGLTGILFSAKNQKDVDFNGNQIITDSRMKLFAWWFESKIASFPECSTWSFSDKGLNIPGVKLTQIESFLQKPDISDLKKEFFELSEKDEDPLLEKKFQEAKKQFLCDLKVLEANSIKAISICNNLLTDHRNTGERMNELSSIDKEILESSVKQTAALVFPTERQLNKLMQDIKPTEDPLKDNIIRSKLIYTELNKSISQYLKAIQ